MQKRLLLLSFVEGAAVMAAELCGARLLAPVFGSSLYVWASVLAVTLGALASGYFFGAVLAGSRNPGRKLLLVLSFASVFLLLMPLLAAGVVPVLSGLPLLIAITAGSLLLLFPAVFLLGASSPLFILLQTDGKVSAGRASGTVYAVSTCGGILATFLCGFLMIPGLGLSLTLIIFGALLLLFTLLIFKAGFSSFGPFALLLIAAQLFSSEHSAAMYRSEGILGLVEVEDRSDSSGTIRQLKVNRIVQSEMDLKSGRSVSAYIEVLEQLMPAAANNQKALVLGLGAGLTATLLQEKGYRAEGVEFDPRIRDCAYRFFGLKASVPCEVADARLYMNRCMEKYGVILVDIFRAEEQPGHVLTAESLEAFKRCMEDSSLLFINWHGYAGGENGAGTAVLLNTLVNGGFRVAVAATGEQEDYRNLLLVCSKTVQPEISAPWRLNEPIDRTERINTDDRPLLELLNAKANKKWRANYLDYYRRSN